MLLGRIGYASTTRNGHSLARELLALRVRRPGTAFGRVRGEMLRGLHRLLLALVVVLACVGITGPFRGLASVRASLSAVAHDRANTPRFGRTPDASSHCEQGAARRVDLRAIESDLDEEDDEALGDVADEPAPPFASASPREAGRPPCVEVGLDTSRFAIRPSLARGPPSSQA